MEKTVSKPPRFAALGYRNFNLLWSGLIVSNMGTWMQNVANGWLVFQLTNSPLWLGVLGLSFAVPMIILPPLAGAVVDRVHRIRLLYITQTTPMLIAFTLAALTWLGVINVWHILIASFLGSAALAFDNPARQALVPDLVDPPDLLNALSLNSATYSGAALVGPALARVMLAPFGAGTLFFLNGVSFLAVIFALAAMRDVRTHSGGAQRSLHHSFWDGLAYSWNNRLLMALLVLSAIGSLFGRSYQTLLPAFSDLWRAGPQGYGLLLASAGGGALVGAFGLASVKHASHHGVLMLVNGLLFSFSLIGFALSTSFWLGIFLLFIVGVTSTIFATIIATFIQVMIPNEMRGRVMSLYTVTLIGLPSLGALGSGAIAEWLGGVDGAPHAVLIAAILLGIILVFVTPVFWKRDLPSRGEASLAKENK
ncbi:MAG TPA: MFS transporter [Anaerolineales bacterium]|nr:MFS transporter [Anaerolineales bacterium]